MFSRLARLAHGIGLAFVLAALAPVPPSAAHPCAVLPVGDGEYVDDRLGIKLAVPRSWTTIPLSVDERWMVAKFLSDKVNNYTEKGGWTMEHRPDLQVIAFVAEAMKEKIKVEKKEDKNGNIDLKVFIENPYKDYEDFLKHRYTGAGWYVSDKKDTKVGDLAVTLYEIKVEKLSMNGPKHLFTAIYHVPDVDIAVQYEVLENSIDKIKNEISRTQKSFKTIPRKGGPLYEVSTGVEWSSLDQDKLTKEERKSRRQGMEQRSQEKATKTAPDGWKVQKMGRFLVMNHADDKFAKSVVDQCEAVWTWLDKTFPFVGEGEYVRSPILRLCANQAEYEAFFRGADYFSINDLEITTYQDFAGKESYMLERVNRRVKEIWFLDRDRELALAMPGWLSYGLDDFVGHIHCGKNGSADFGKDYWNRDDVKERLREGRLTQARDLFTKTAKDFSDYSQFQESAQLFAYFVTGAAAKDKRTKNVLPDYVRNLKDVVLELKKGADKDDEKTPQTEEEENALFKARHQGYTQKEKDLLEDTFRRTFAGWSDADWKKFQDSYEKNL